MSAARTAATWLLLALVGALVLLDLSADVSDALLVAVLVLGGVLALARFLAWLRELDLPRSDR